MSVMEAIISQPIVITDTKLPVLHVSIIYVLCKIIIIKWSILYKIQKGEFLVQMYAFFLSYYHRSLLF